ncbi:MAG: hypothetical protein LBD17_02715 [Endomicrobium sp.]|jgi:hypothetical protein|nr:hypothetical protein [Endomicrobium sp.]
MSIDYPINFWLEQDNNNRIDKNIYIGDFVKPVKEILLYRNHYSDIIRQKRLITQYSINKRMEISAYNDILSLHIPDIKAREAISKSINGYTITSNKTLAYNDHIYLLKIITLEEFKKNAKRFEFELNVLSWIYDIYDTGIICFIFSNFNNSKNNSSNLSNPHFVEYKLFGKNNICKKICEKLDFIDRYKNVKDEDLQNCTEIDMGTTDIVYAYYENSNTNENLPSTKNFSDKREAYEYFDFMSKGKIVIREGVDINCISCSANSFCMQNINKLRHKRKNT